VDADVIVRGEAEGRAAPDRATIRVVIDGEGAERDDAYTKAAQAAAAVDDVVAQHRDDLERVNTASLIVHPRWKKGESVRRAPRCSRRPRSIDSVS
jgi:uncharacterized protein YggE